MDLSLLVDVGSIATILGLIIAVVELYLNQRKAKKGLELNKQYLLNLSKLVESHIKRQESQQQLEKDKFEWQKLRDVAKTLWGLIQE